MALFTAPVIDAPEPRGRRYGLLTAATGPLLLPEPAGLGGGVRYEPVSCGGAHIYPIECDTTPPEKTFDPGQGMVTAAPFLAYSTLLCGAAGYTSDELETKVRRRLESGEQSAAEQGLATAIAAAPPTALTAPDPNNIASVIGELEQWLYGTSGYGNVGFLHAPFRMSAWALGASVVLKDGPIWRTQLGTVWIPGDYPDNGTVYITGHVTVWRAAEVAVAPPDQTFDRITNQRYMLAEREYAVAWDCYAASATFDPDLVVS